jgi:cytochrome bd-type quinol oxidase subunit 2
MIKKRNMLVQILLMIITFGFYSIYWFYQTATELKHKANDLEAAPGLWTVVMFIPFGIFYSHYKYSELFEKTSSEKMNKWLVFVLWIVFSPAVWFIVQTELNRSANT